MESSKLTTSLLTEGDLQELRLVFEAFDHDSDGLLDVEEVGALLQSFGKAMTEAEVRHQPICVGAPSRRTFQLAHLLIPHHATRQVLDMVTELKPDLKKLPFEDFVNVVCRPMVSPAALEEEVKEVFTLFSGSGAAVTPQTLQQAMGSLDLPVSKLLVKTAPEPAKGHVPSRLHLPTCVRAALLGVAERRDGA